MSIVDYTDANDAKIGIKCYDGNSSQINNYPLNCF